MGITDIPKNHWWGYLHSNGSIQVKRWFGDHKDYTDDCENNPFVIRVVHPIQALDAEEARQRITRILDLP